MEVLVATGRRRRVAIFAGLAVVAGIFSSSPLWAGHLGRQIPWLEVRRVEISGTRLLAPHEVLAASGVEQGQHLLDEVAVWENALREHPVIADARLTRRPPGTLRIRIVEKRPVALVGDGLLRLATADAELLPVDPVSVPLDLPIVRVRLADSTSIELARPALAEVARLSNLAPDLMRDVSEVHLVPSAPDVLVLAHRNAEIHLPIGASPVRLSELGRVLADTQRRFPTPESGVSTSRLRLDLRFADQVVVRPSSSRERS
jgi:cell division protein FtsQ